MDIASFSENPFFWLFVEGVGVIIWAVAEARLVYAVVYTAVVGSVWLGTSGWAKRRMWRRHGNMFTAEPEWQWSDQVIWKTGTGSRRDEYSLRTSLCARFANADDVSHIVRAARLTLQRRRRAFGSALIAWSDEPWCWSKVKTESAKARLLKGSGDGIKIEAHSLGEQLYFSFVTELPNGATSLDERHLVRVSFQVLGGSDLVIDMPVHCPKRFETVPYDRTGRPVIDGLSIQPEEERSVLDGRDDSVKLGDT
jgi:hypothetical protein